MSPLSLAQHAISSVVRGLRWFFLEGAGPISPAFIMSGICVALCQCNAVLWLAFAPYDDDPPWIGEIWAMCVAALTLTFLIRGAYAIIEGIRHDR